jgi:hypothetical protein
MIYRQTSPTEINEAKDGLLGESTGLIEASKEVIEEKVSTHKTSRLIRKITLLDIELFVFL